MIKKTLIEVLNDPKGREIIENIEYLEDSKDEELIRVKKNLIDELKEEFGYNYQEV